MIGAITRDKVRIVRESDAIFREEISKAGLDKEIWQYFTVCPGTKSVGVEDGRRTYSQAVVLHASTDSMSAKVAKLPYELLERICPSHHRRGGRESTGSCDVTPKPPGAIEWE